MAAARALVTFIKHELADSHVPEEIDDKELKYLKNLSALSATCEVARAELHPTIFKRSLRELNEERFKGKRVLSHRKYTFQFVKVGDAVSFVHYERYGGGENVTCKHVTVIRKTTLTFDVMVNGERRKFHRSTVSSFYMSPPSEHMFVLYYYPPHNRD